MDDLNGINCKPKYMYDQPMFMVVVNTVVIDENGVLMIPNKNLEYRFPRGIVDAGHETIQFAAVRHVKEQLGVVVKKKSLIPIDFRNNPSVLNAENIIDIGFVVFLEDANCNPHMIDSNYSWVEVDFEEKKAILGNNKFISKDNEVLLRRALEVVLMIKD